MALGAELFRIEGVSGDLVPILGFRWGGERTFEEAEAAGAAEVAPSPHDFPQFLGPRRDGKVAGVELARDWDASPPREVWRREVGAGWASFAVVGDAAVTQEQRGDEETVVRYDLHTGEVVWVHADPVRYESTIAGTGPRATPAVAAGRVYTVGATGVLNCLDLATGERLWRHDLAEEHGAAVPEWGKSSSPLVQDRLVVVPAGAEGRSLVAYDAATGELAWAGGDDASGYSSPRPAVLAGRPQILLLNRSSVAAHDPADGDLLWEHPWPDGQPNVADPLPIGDDRVLVSSGYGVGSSLLRVSRRSGSFEVEELWHSPRMKAKFTNLVLHEGYVYGLDDGILACLDPESGELRWKRGRYGHGQVLLVGDLLLVQAEDGEVALVEPNPEELRELGRFQALSDKTWNVPTVAGPYLLVRNHREAACFELPLHHSFRQ